MSEFTELCDYMNHAWSNFLAEASISMDFYKGAQWGKKDSDKADKRGTDLFVINKMRRHVNLLHGYEIRNRHILKIEPIGLEDDKASQQHTGLIMYQMNKGGYAIMSEAFKYGTIISGSNLIEIWRDAYGNIRFDRLGFNQFKLDPGLTKRDLTDNDNLITGRWVNKDRVFSILPTGADKVKNIPYLNTSDRWPHMSNPPLDNKQKFRLIERHYERKTKYTDVVINRMSGQKINWVDLIKKVGGYSNARWLMNNAKINDMPVLTKISEPDEKIHLTYYVDGVEVWSGENPILSNDFPFVWLNGDFAPEMSRDDLKLQSYLDSLKDPQRIRNKRAVQAVDIIESQIQTMRILRDKYIKNVKDTYKTGQAVPIHIKDDAPDNISTDEIFKQVGAPDIPPGMFAIMDMLDKDGVEVGGLNDEIFGSDDKEIPGILNRYRTGQALTGQQWMFEIFREAKSELGRKLLRINQLNMNPQRISRILNEMPVPEFYSPDFDNYDCKPTEGLLTDTQQQLFYSELLNLRTQFDDFKQILTPSLMVRYMPIQFRQELMKAIQAGEQRMSQAMGEQMQNQQQMNQLLQAQAAEDIADSEQSRASAQLDRVKSLVEIQKLRSEPLLALMDKYIEIKKLEATKNAVSQRKKEG